MTCSRVNLPTPRCLPPGGPYYRVIRTTTPPIQSE
jgi:hypothetical protein